MDYTVATSQLKLNAEFHSKKDIPKQNSKIQSDAGVENDNRYKIHVFFSVFKVAVGTFCSEQQGHQSMCLSFFN